jgi:hypothetical protein
MTAARLAVPLINNGFAFGAALMLGEWFSRQGVAVGAALDEGSVAAVPELAGAGVAFAAVRRPFIEHVEIRAVGGYVAGFAAGKACRWQLFSPPFRFQFPVSPFALLRNC